MELNEVCRERLVAGVHRALDRVFDSDLSDIDQKNLIRKAIHDMNVGALDCEHHPKED
ncbi:hypothetical protein KAR91_05315 [Candidatus Pacearchaeota archaeon]|nr:hypothetical protein [Candidatus Pacearchaeota archaeon]